MDQRKIIKGHVPEHKLAVTMARIVSKKVFKNISCLLIEINLVCSIVIFWSQIGTIRIS